MTIGWVWGLVGTLGFFAFTLILEVVKLTRSLKSSDDELASARQKIATLDEKHNETIADLKKLHQREMEELCKKPIHKKYPLVTLSEISISVLSEISNYENYLKTSNTDAFCVLDELAMAKFLKLSHQELIYHLEQLSSAYCIEHYPSGKYGGLRSKGRELLHEKGLLPQSESKV